MVRIDPEGRFVDVRFPATAEVDPGESWIGRRIDEVLSPHESSAWRQLIQRCLETGELQCDRLRVDEPNHRRVYEVRLTRVSEREVLGLARDVTEEEEVRVREADSQRFLAGVTAATPYILYVHDLRESRNLYSNRSLATHLGYGPEEAEGITRDPLPALVHPDDDVRVQQLLEQLASLGDGEIAETEARFRDAQGDWRWFRSRTSVFSRDDDGAPRSVFGAMEEITERRELERQINQTQKLEAVGQVAASIAHDFNNQLTAIGGFSELLLNEVGEDERASSYAAYVLAAVDRATALTSKLLSFSRSVPKAPVVLDAYAFVEELVPLLQRLVGDRVEVVVDSRSGSAHIEIDPPELEQVILNLAINARDAMPNGGTLSLSVLRTGGSDEPVDSGGDREVAIVVSDTGSGMDEGVRRHLFEPFFSTKATGHGTGLGLASVDRIIKAARGRVEVATEVGKGSTFTLYLPETEIPATDAAILDATPETRGSETVLVVDDDPAVLRLERETLEINGYRVLVAGGAEEAIALAAGEERIDLLLTDVMMPGMTGPQLAKHLLQGQESLPIVYVTGYADRTLVNEAGGGRLLAKPFAPRELVATVRSVLDES